jgi:hypothetical protein
MRRRNHRQAINVGYFIEIGIEINLLEQRFIWIWMDKARVIASHPYPARSRTRTLNVVLNRDGSPRPDRSGLAMTESGFIGGKSKTISIWMDEARVIAKSVATRQSMS